jgi:hypothetical protein
VSNTYCDVFLFCFSSSCVLYVANFSGLSISDYPSLFYNVHASYQRVFDSTLPDKVCQ